MYAPRHIEREILLALYRYSLLTSEHLSTLLHYEQNTIYNAFHTLKQKRWLEQLPLTFVQKNVKGWTLSKDGMEVAFGLTKEYRTHLLRRTNVAIGQTAHLYGSNRFFIHLIRESRSRSADEGLVDWIGMRDSGDRYPVFDAKGKKSTPLRPDGIGAYRFEDGRETVFHVEYDTGSEHLWVLHHKLWQYADTLKGFWDDVSLANVLFITRDINRSMRIMELWQDIRDDAFRRQPVPTVWTTTESALNENGVFASVWNGVSDDRVSFSDFPRLHGTPADSRVPLGKQIREQPFPNTMKKVDKS